MKRIFTIALVLFFSSSLLNAQTTHSVSDVYRVVESYSLDDPYNQAFMRYGGELPILLMDAARTGTIQTYSFNNFMSTPISFELVMERMIMEQQVYDDPWEDDWGFGWEYESWDVSNLYYEGDIVEYEGIAFVSLMDENEGNDPMWNPDLWTEYEGTVYYFLDTDLRDLKVEYLVGMRKGKIKFKQPLFLHFYIPAENTMEGFQKYIVSFSFEDCLRVLNDHNIVWHQFANPEWGYVSGEIFLWDDWGEKQGKFATDILKKVSSGKLPLHDSIDLNAIPNLEELLNIEVEEEPYTFRIRNLPEQPGSIQIMYSYWGGFSEADYLTTVDINPLLEEFTYTEGFMSYGQAIFNGKLIPAPGSIIDTIDHNGMLVDQFSSIKISEIKSVEISQMSIPDYQQGTYSMLVSEIANLYEAGNNIFLQPEKEISRILIEKARNGELSIYTNDSLSSQMTMEEFNKNLTPYTEEFVDYDLWMGIWDETITYSSWDLVTYNDIEYESMIDENTGQIPDKSPDAWMPRISESYEYEPSEVSMLQITYRNTFDQQGKKISSTPVAIGLNVGSDFNETGLMMPVATFNFTEVEKALENAPAFEVSQNDQSVIMTDIIRDHQLITSHFSSRYIEYVKD